MEWLRPFVYTLIVLGIFGSTFYFSSEKGVGKHTAKNEPETLPGGDQKDLKLFEQLFEDPTLDSIQIVIRRKDSENRSPEVSINTYNQVGQPDGQRLTENKTRAVSKKIEKGELSDQDYFKTMVNDYYETVLTVRKYRNDVVVRYYKRNVDGDKAQVLNKFGFYLHERPVAESTQNSRPSNTIRYGKDFPLRDLKLITYLLLNNGIEIKQMAPFKNYGGWKHKSVEIGSDPKLADQTPLTLNQVRYYTKQ